MRISSAQFNPIDKDIDYNLKVHYELIEQAAGFKTDLIVFPELSISGYLRDQADEYSFLPEDKRLDVFKGLSKSLKITIVAGAPIKIFNQLYIGAFIIKPDETIDIYTKQYLHQGENEFYDYSFEFNPLIEIHDEIISIAICADTSNPLHAEKAAIRDSTFYLVSIFSTRNGMKKEYRQLQHYAEKYSMNVLLSNFSGESFSLKSGGKSAFWSNKGELITSLGEDKQGLIILEKDNRSWNILRND